MENSVHLVMTEEVKEVLNEWADDFDASAKKFRNPEFKNNAGFFRSLTMIGMQTGTSVNKDAVDLLLRNAQVKLTLKDAKVMPKSVREAFCHEAQIIISWLGKHGIS